VREIGDLCKLGPSFIIFHCEYIALYIVANWEALLLFFFFFFFFFFFSVDEC